MLNKDANICKKILKYCGNIQNDVKSKGNDKEKLLNDETYFQSVCFALLQIGEILGNISYSFMEKYPDVPVKNIRGLRNRIVHGYGSIDANMIWEIATVDIPNLEEQINNALNDFLNNN